MTSKERLTTICNENIAKLSLEKPAKDRLAKELQEVENQNEYDYFLSLLDKGAKFAKNDNNLLIPYLLGLCDPPDLTRPPITTMGDFPDIDVDYLPEVQSYLRNTWAKKTFGSENTCTIGNYTTFGIKSAFIDMARVFGADRSEILGITTKLGSKDDDGKSLTYEKAVELFPDFKEYCEKYPDLANAAKKLINRNRGMGKHAGGLIISSVPITNLVPLVKGKDDVGDMLVSAFPEGLHGTDLSPLGLIKFDFLVVNDLKRISDCCELIKARHKHVKNELVQEVEGQKEKTICAKPNQGNWTDTSYLNDPKCLKVASAGNLRGVFQFDSDGIRALCREGGVDSFNDLVAYSALFRPGPMAASAHTSYINRKNGKETYEIHPLLQPVLGYTYGLMVYQEQIMRVLNLVGDIPLIYCEKIRKAISKKKIKDFMVFRDQFVENGQKRLGWDKAKVEELWQQVEFFSEYGFNLSHATAYTYVSSRLLWLKTYYPLEFFTATLQNESKTDKVKEYKREAQKMHVNIRSIDLNKSKANFNIVGKEIYIGFSNIKGIGTEVAERIVAGQPYSSFEDFLERFGTDASVLKPLIALGVFKDAERATLHEFWEKYKETEKKREDRNKRANKNLEEILLDMKQDKKTVEGWLSIENESDFDRVIGAGGELDFLTCDLDSVLESKKNISEDDAAKLWRLLKKYKKTYLGLKAKIEQDEKITLAGFVPSGNIEDKFKLVYDALPNVAESVHYGFSWEHDLEYSPDYEGDMTFDRFEDDNFAVLPVECTMVQPVKEVMSKKGNIYYSLKVEDVNGKQSDVRLWQEDYDRFKEEFDFFDKAKNRGHLFRMRVERPSPGFRSYTFESYPKQIRHKKIPKEKKDDYRLLTLREPEKKK